MMAPDYAHWHGMYEVAERFYMQLIPMAREIAERAAENGETEAAETVLELIESILARPEHQWFERPRKKKRPLQNSIPLRLWPMIWASGN